MINKRVISKSYLISLINECTDKEFISIIINWLERYEKIVIREDTRKWH